MKRKNILIAGCVGVALGIALYATAVSASAAASDTQVCLRFRGADGTDAALTAIMSTCRVVGSQRIHREIIGNSAVVCVDQVTLFGTDSEAIMHLNALQQGVNFQSNDDYREAALTYVSAGLIPGQSGIVIAVDDIVDGEIVIDLEPAIQITGRCLHEGGDPFGLSVAMYNGQGDSYAWPDGAFSIYTPLSSLGRDVFVHAIPTQDRVVRIPAEDIVAAYDSESGIADVSIVTIPLSQVDSEREVTVEVVNLAPFTPGRLGVESLYFLNQSDGTIAHASVYEQFDGSFSAKCRLTPGTHSVISFPSGDPTDKSQYLTQRYDPFLLIEHLIDTEPWLEPAPLPGNTILPEIIVPQQTVDPSPVGVTVEHAAAHSATAALTAPLRELPE